MGNSIRRRKALVITPYFLIIKPFLILFSSVGAEESLYLFCPNEANYTLNSPFENNLKLLLQILPSSTSTTGFNSTSIGEPPNKVNGQALCRGDVSSTICQTCVENASRYILGQCKSTDAIIWYQLCQVRYSFRTDSYFSSYTLGKYPPCDSHVVANPAPFFKAVTHLMTNLTNQVSLNSSKPMFATGEVKFSRTETIYGLVQCTRDISVVNCKSCLDSAYGDLKGSCNTRRGGILVSRSCNLRFEVYSFYNASSNLVTYPISSSGSGWKIWMIVSAACVAMFIGFCLFCCLRKREKQKALFAGAGRSEQAFLQELGTPRGVEMNEKGELASAIELSFVDLQTLIAATDNFSDSNKLGQGGFGSVYKGTLPDGKEVAIKRLSRKSWQGLEEFKNEIILIAKLQHRNLVRLLGYGIEGEEKLLIYEFMPNNSLDTLIFDPERRSELEWGSYFNIICGIARGLLYLHEDSRPKIIHRDLKPSNVLLDGELVAKISDFGMARIFGEHQNTANTRRVVGTHGYMAPEYAMEGLFSVKSDVFSFGVILLEMISGKNNSGFYLTEIAQTLIAYAWRLWQEGKEMEFMDDRLLRRETAEMVRCMHIGLLCVQEEQAERPTMSFVVAVLLSSDPAAATTLPQPKQPAFSVGRNPALPTHSSCSQNHTITVSSISPR